MANFTTHIGVGTIVAGGLATLTLAADVVAPENLLAVTLAGVIGSVLPDIDLKDSRPSRFMFAGLAVIFSFAVLFNAATKLSVTELWILWLGTLAFVRYGLHAVFHRFCVHRGIWHSLLAAVFASVATAVVYFHVLQRPDGVAWLAAGFMMVGFLTHLILDEIYAVDVMDVRVKSSFGTALKLFDRRHVLASVGMAAATAGAIYVSPPTSLFVSGISSEKMWHGLNRRLLPQDNDWFGLAELQNRYRSGGIMRPGQTAPLPSGMTTGSLPNDETSATGAPQIEPAD